MVSKRKQRRLVSTEKENFVEDILGRMSGIPLHICSDQEGDYSQDYARGGVNLFPSQMGMTATGPSWSRSTWPRTGR